jgi:hypothetical protein
MAIFVPGRSLGTGIPITVSDSARNLRMDSVSAHYLTNEGSSTATVPIDTLDSPSSPAYTLTIPSGGGQELEPYALRARSTGSANAASLIAYY